MKMELIYLLFCTKCGTELVDGITHECSVQTTIYQTAATQAVPASAKSIPFNVNLLQRLLINPFAAKTLDSNTDLVEGMAFCSKCGIEIKPNSAFCEHKWNSINVWGLLRITFCSKCGVEIKPNSAFCGECSAPTVKCGF
ncbi:MAG: zinc-ribbon domain-containing protein [Desulfitobacteriaceae bacterium]